MNIFTKVKTSLGYVENNNFNILGDVTFGRAILVVFPLLRRGSALSNTSSEAVDTCRLITGSF